MSKPVLYMKKYAVTSNNFY